jgi:ribonuclease R
VHIADVSYFVKPGSPLDEEGYRRGNSTYFPGHVIPMLPEVLSNGVCSLVKGSPRLVKSAFIWLDDKGQPAKTAFANSIINSFKRLRYIEAQDLIDGKETIHHPEADRQRSDYEPKLLKLLGDMNTLARLIQRRRHEAGQIVLNIPQVDLVLDEEGKVVGAKKEDDSFTHTLIEMFMVEANEAVSRLFAKMGVPHMRRIHPGPDAEAEVRLKHFTMSCGYKIPENLDRKAIQALLASVKDKPEEFAINLAILKSISRAEYSPKLIGHFALASENYSHFTSPIRRYADLTIHRLLDRFFEVSQASFKDGPASPPKRGEKLNMTDVPTTEELEDVGKYISYSERRSEDAERELRKVKVLELLEQQVGDEFKGVVTGITNFGLFIQIDTYLIEGLTRYEDLIDDWWDVDTKAGVIRGERSGTVMRIGDVVRVRIVRVDVPRREMDLHVFEVLSRGKAGTGKGKHEGKKKPKEFEAKPVHTGADKRTRRSKGRDKRKQKTAEKRKSPR